MRRFTLLGGLPSREGKSDQYREGYILKRVKDKCKQGVRKLVSRLFPGVDYSLPHQVRGKVAAVRPDDGAATVTTEKEG
jgi:hypothetical protein